MNRTPKVKKEWSKQNMFTFISSRLWGNLELRFGPAMQMFTGIKSEDELVRNLVTFLEKLRIFDPENTRHTGKVFLKSDNQKERKRSNIL
jgi:hypothetical protein